MISLTQLLFRYWGVGEEDADKRWSLYEITPMKFTADQQLTYNYICFSTDYSFESFGRDKYAGMVESEIQNQEYSLKLIGHPLKFNQPFTLTNQYKGVIKTGHMEYLDGVYARPIFSNAEWM